MQLKMEAMLQSMPFNKIMMVRINRMVRMLIMMSVKMMVTIVVLLIQWSKVLATFGGGGAIVSL